MTLASLGLLDAYSKTGFPPGYPPGSRTLFSPVDDVHAALVLLAASATSSLVVAMYGFDDQELADVIAEKMGHPDIFVQLTLDSSQAGGGHERAILAAADYPACSVAVGRSERGAIMHLKLMIVDGVDLVSGSTNWSAGGEAAQDNQMTVIREPLAAAAARARVDAIHTNMLQVQVQAALKAAGTGRKPHDLHPV